MVKLNNHQIKWGVKKIISGKLSSKEVAEIYEVTPRHFQNLVKKYKETGLYPVMKKERRPRTELSEEDKKLIDEAVEESLLCGAVKLRLYIDKKYKKKLPYNKIHKHLLKKGVSQEDKKKKKQRKYCRYEREHSFSLVHLDYHDSKFAVGKFVCGVEDDASRLILCGGEFDSEEAIHAIKLMKQAIKIAYEKYSSVIRECNTDKGTQFYNSTLSKNGKRTLGEFELCLQKNKINHIPSRRNHPQTNGKKERWFRTYEENRHKFKSFEEFVKWYNDMIHLGLSRMEGITPNEAVMNKLRPESVLGLFLRLNDGK
ncbi:MAG: hypothetical protein ABIA78_00810 [archaeon]